MGKGFLWWVMKIFYILTEVRDGYMKVIKLHTRAKFTACKLCFHKKKRREGRKKDA